jgi:uncharacterized membrane protein YkoI
MLRVILLALLINVGTFSTVVLAADKQGHKKITSSKEAAKLVKKRYGGTVLKVKRQKGKGAYKVKIVKPNGQVMSKKVNARTGKIERN